MSEDSALSLTQPGGFVVGCNYWASHAGTAMWSDWRPEVISADLQTLAKSGLQVIRVFPLWPDFQPLNLLRTYRGGAVEYRHGEEPLPDSEAGRAGVSAEMMDRFGSLVEIAETNGLRLVVGLLTGWMSGRLFVPPALEARNVLTDPAAMLWQVRFVQHFVRRFRTAAAVVAWDLGNECNCMGHADREQAWLWTATLVNAIRAIDPERPVISGMHSLKVEPQAAWSIADQGELTDVLTTHPYPLFTPHCDCDPINTMRSCLHATAESRLYSDLGGRPCIAEELGTLGPMIASNRIAADYVRCNLFSLWAHDCHGLLWWCAFDQTHLEHAPYDWHGLERELGMFQADRSPKPVVEEMRQFRQVLQDMPFAKLPPHRREAVCILSAGQDHWGVAFSAFILAKQAGYDISFQHETQPLPDASVYLLPCVKGSRIISRRRWDDLRARVEAGATLYISHEDGLMPEFQSLTGLKVLTRQRRTEPAQVVMSGVSDQPTLPLDGPFKLALRATRAAVLGKEQDDYPAFTSHTLGKGRVFFLSLPLETYLVSRPGVFYERSAPSYHLVYKHVFASAGIERVVQRKTAQVGLTEHVLEDGALVVVAINYSPLPVKESFRLAEGWTLRRSLHGQVVHRPAGDELVSTLHGNDAIVFIVEKTPTA